VRLDQPINMVLAEHIMVVAFQRQGQTLSQQEMTVTELYSQRQEDNTKKLLMEFYTKGGDRLQQTNFSSFTVDTPIVVQESYVLPFTVKGMALTQTQHHITGKSLVVVNQNNLVYQLDANLFSARRPHGDSLTAGLPAIEDLKKELTTQLVTSADLKSKDLPVYDAVIPLIPTKYLSYGLPLVGLKEVKAFPTRLESTTQVLVYGFDIFYTRLSPENNFDLVQEHFNYTLLFAFILGLALTTVFVKSYIAKTKRRNAFLTN